MVRRVKIRKLALVGLSTLSGVLYFLGFVGFDQWYLAWVALAPLLVALGKARTGKHALALSWWMGFVAHLGGYHWIIHLLRVFAYLSLPLSVLGYLLLCIVQGALFGAFGWLAWALRRRTGIGMGWVAPVALMATEFVFPLIFPSYMANSQAWVSHLTQVVDLGGVLMLSGIIGLVNGAVAEMASARLHKARLPRWLPASAAAALAFTVGYSHLRIRQVEALERSAPRLKTAIIQANVGAADKHLRVEEGIGRFREMTDQTGEIPDIGLLIWPEGAFNRVVVGEPNMTGHVASQVKAPMIVGAARGENGPDGIKVWNTALSLEPGGEITGHYDKIALLVFGEYIPGDRLFPGIYKLLPYSSHYERGTSYAPLPVGPYRFSTEICYEDILPRLVRDLMGPIDDRGTRPHAMVNITNDSWYGPVEPRIHLALATFRAIEHRRWLLRSTATGVSAFIDSAGRVVQRSEFEKAQTLIRDVPMIADGPTVYGVVGDLLGWLALAACIGGLVQKRWRCDADGSRRA
jgi:apolipoprotein N-acyltransferase